MAAKKRQNLALEVANAIDKAMTLAGRDLYDAAWEVLKRAEQAAHDLPSGFMYWGLAVVADHRQNAPDAVRYIMLALKQDPCAPPFRGSYQIIRDRVVGTFKELDVADAAVPTFFRLIADLDAVDAPALIKLSRHVAAEGNHEAALGLAQDAVDREPQNAEALRHLARMLASAGRHQEARARRSEAEALAVTFSCPPAQA